MKRIPLTSRFVLGLLVLTVSVPRQAFAVRFEEHYAASRFSRLSKDYFDRFSRDVGARVAANETCIGGDWRIVVDTGSSPLARRMAGHLSDFFRQAMGVFLPVVERSPDQLGNVVKAVVLSEHGGGKKECPASFTILVNQNQVFVSGHDAPGLRDGVVRLVDLVGFRQAPMLSRGEQTYLPRLGLRVGFKPTLGTMRDVVFLGYNAVTSGLTDFYTISTSHVIPELVTLQRPGLRERILCDVRDAHHYRLKSYLFVRTARKFAENAALFRAHPGIRGVRTWRADGLFSLCPEAPLVKQYLEDSVRRLFRDAPHLDGLLLIVGGEGFYHCYMRPYGVGKGKTTCKRCAPLGADQAVANLCNRLAQAAREVNPHAEIVAWPYSAMHVWSADRAQTGFIRRLKPGVALLTEIEKDEVLFKPRGVRKAIWDYSIDFIGPSARAKQQIAVCRQAGVKVYLRSEPELAFEASGLPHVPCLDRWVDRAEALAASGAAGAWVFPAFLPYYSTSTAEVFKYMWWDPVADKETLLGQFAARLAGRAAAPRLRQAWRYVSAAINYHPEIPPYYQGPHYFGPAHPMCANPTAELPPEFYAGYGYFAEVSPEAARVKRPTFTVHPRGDVPVFAEYYAKLEKTLGKAVQEIEAAEPAVESRCRLTFDSEALAVRWFHHIARTERNFYQSCQLRDRLLTLAAQADAAHGASTAMRKEALPLLKRWTAVLEDERANARAALPVMEADMRLDFRYRGFCPGPEMIRAKLKLLDGELTEFLPHVAHALGISDSSGP